MPTLEPQALDPDPPGAGRRHHGDADHGPAQEGTAQRLDSRRAAGRRALAGAPRRPRLHAALRAGARGPACTPASWASPISTRAAIEAMPAGAIAVVDAMGTTDAGIFGDILCARDGPARRRRGDHRRRRPRPRRRALDKPTGVVPRHGGAGIGQRPDLRRLAGADRLRGRRCPAQRRHRRRRRRCGRHSRRTRRRRRRRCGRAGATGRLDHGRGRERRRAARPLSGQRRDARPLRRLGQGTGQKANRRRRG